LAINYKFCIAMTKCGLKDFSALSKNSGWVQLAAYAKPKGEQIENDA